MPRGRARRGRGRGRGTSTSAGGVKENQVTSGGEKEEEGESGEEMKPTSTPRRRGRPSSRGGATAAAATSSIRFLDSSLNKREFVSRTILMKLEKSLNPSENDTDIVHCSDCDYSIGEMTYFQFRLHNIMYHLNTAATVDEKADLVMDHKYFARKLNEFKKLTKAVSFDCPRVNCTSSFKSTLGLAYHINTCGRTAEELAVVLVECEVCHVKLSLPNLQWHKKSHEVGARKTHPADQIQQISRKRQAALKAKKTLKGVSAEGKSQDDSSVESSSSDEIEVNETSKPLFKAANKSQARVDRDNNDFCNIAVDFLETLDSETKAWDEPIRNGEDSLFRITDNELRSLSGNDDPETYLPLHKNSVEFKFVVDDDESAYHRLPWFEGETVANSASIHQTGGPVLSMSWHPSGKLLAVSVGKDWKEEIDALNCQERRSCIQIYKVSSYNISLQLIIGVEWGYALHIQWSSFWPDIMDSFNTSVNSCFDDIELLCRIGYLAMACEDSTVRIMAIGIENLKVAPNYEYKPNHWVKIYTKTPEICLKIHESVIDEDLGNVIKFDWHEQHRFVAAGYANGMIAVYDLETISPLLTETVIEYDYPVTVINPIWVFQGHRLPVTGICFDPSDPRYLVTAAQDRTIKVWDMETRMLRDTKRAGICLDMCWIRGWIHQTLSFESHVAYQSSMHNYARVFQIGSSISRPTSAELLNFTTLDFYNGLTAQGTDDGKVNVTYFDWFWRECDFERNRKKKNLAVLSTLEVDPDSYKKMSTSDFTACVKKLRSSIHSSKVFQRLGINDDEGVYSGMLEAKFGGPTIFESLDALEAEKRDQVETDALDPGPGSIDNSVAEIESDSYLRFPKKNDGLIPVYDVNIREEEPKLIISFLKQRPTSSVPTGGFDDKRVEEYVRFQSFIRVNKVSWCPNGKVIAVGYRNGLITVLPGGFEQIFKPSSKKDHSNYLA